MKCQICSNEESKYKCPSCLIAYCSVGCWTSHKTAKCVARNGAARQANSAESLSTAHYTHTTQDTVPVEKLRLLEGSEGVRRLLKNPHLRDMLVAVEGSPEPAAALQTAMLEPLFVEFVDECLKVVEPPSS
ncbi:zinc finger HIT domain-containing protein 3 [Bacillus rossius redtenbacheri]|uniref:zinc finger HIT domain-containing protein 3 n=1 Tax=Bacillus rossius redtenbacheri TaxID=93214 RepID=UPI002FDDE1D7